MFGGHGIFLEGLMFALVADSVLYLMVDEDTSAQFASRALEAFTYNKKGKEYKMSCFQAPEEALEDSGEMAIWVVNKAYDAALKYKSDLTPFISEFLRPFAMIKLD